MSANYYGVQAGYLSREIYVGRLNAKRTAFLDKQAHTDMVLAAVAEYVRLNFDGGMKADFPGLGVEVEINVRPRTQPASPQPADGHLGHERESEESA